MAPRCWGPVPMQAARPRHHLLRRRRATAPILVTGTVVSVPTRIARFWRRLRGSVPRRRHRRTDAKSIEQGATTNAPARYNVGILQGMDFAFHATDLLPTSPE
jgi:hypothetical protein